MAYFDDVLIPWDRVFHVGDPDHAKFYPQRLFDWIHIETQIRHVVNAEMIAGLGVLITEALGTSQAPIVASQLADLVRFRETCRAFMIAAEETGFDSPGGLYKANNIFVDFGRAYYLENVHTMIETLIDFCGRGVVVFPTKADLDHPEIGPELRLALRGHNISAEDRTTHLQVHPRALPDRLGRAPRDVREVQRHAAVGDQAADDAARRIPGRRTAHRSSPATPSASATSPSSPTRMDEEKADYPSIRYRPTYVALQDVEKTAAEIEAIAEQT